MCNKIIYGCFCKKTVSELENYPELQGIASAYPDSPFAQKIPSVAASRFSDLEKYQHYLKQWEELGLNAEWFAGDPEAIQTLFTTRLIYSIVGFQNTVPSGPSGLLFKEGKIWMRVEGDYQPVVDVVKEKFIYSRIGGGTILRLEDQSNWTYLGTSGLAPIDRWSHDTFEPVIQIDEEQLKCLKNHVQESSRELLPDSPCFIQLVTNPRDFCFEPTSLKEMLQKNYRKHFPLHAAIRLIDKDGRVYSTGFGSSEDEDEKQRQLGYFSTINGVPTILDYEELRPHEGRITLTHAISLEKFEETLEAIQRDRLNTIRFNIRTQNCNTLAVRYLSIAGISFGEIKMKIKDLFIAILPDLLPQRIKNKIPKALTSLAEKVANFFFSVIFFPISFFLLAPYALYHGWNRGSKVAERKTPPHPSDMDVFEKEALSIWTNIFEEEADFSFKTVEKQLAPSYGAVWAHNYRGPNMSIVPPQDPKEREEDLETLRAMRELFSLPTEENILPREILVVS